MKLSLYMLLGAVVGQMWTAMSISDFVADHAMAKHRAKMARNRHRGRSWAQLAKRTKNDSGLKRSHASRLAHYRAHWLH